MVKRRRPRYVADICLELRRNQTPAERVLWKALRGRRLAGFKFRRQHALGRYIADFYCARARLVVEIDGAIHQDPDRRLEDSVREEEISSRGLSIVRFTNDEVLKQTENVLQRLQAQIVQLTETSEPPVPCRYSPSPHGGEGAGG